MMHQFTTEELRNLIQGKFTFRSCIACQGKGTELVDGRAGMLANFVDPERPEDFYTDTCQDCRGLGGTLKIEETE